MIDIVRRLIAAGIALGAIVGNADHIDHFFGETIALAQQTATAGDLRLISDMLDYEYMRKGRYPRSDRFECWMAATFKQSHLKPLTSDHWGNTLQYAAASDRKSYQLISPGPDGVIGTHDDMACAGP